jgi:hypothetical protein
MMKTDATRTLLHYQVAEMEIVGDFDALDIDSGDVLHVRTCLTRTCVVDLENGERGLRKLDRMVPLADEIHHAKSGYLTFRDVMKAPYSAKGAQHFRYGKRSA